MASADVERRTGLERPKQPGSSCAEPNPVDRGTGGETSRTSEAEGDAIASGMRRDDNPSVSSSPRFETGQMVHHVKFDYRGVITAVDVDFQGSETWYETVARSRPPRDRPWYHVLVHGASHATYVAERHLELDDSGQPVRHPMLSLFFDELRDGRYVLTRPLN